MGTLGKLIGALTVVVVLAGAAHGNWADSFDGGKLNLAWQFPSVPQITGTFKQVVVAGTDGNHYLTFTETTPYDTPNKKYGAAFGAGFGTTEKFKDVRVGATVNVAGDASHNYYGLLARASYEMDPDGKKFGAPGMWADCYIMHINYSYGPANVDLDIEKVVKNSNVMDKDIGAVVPNVVNARSYYAELDVVGSGPVYVTGSLYEYKGGPLVARTPTMVDTDAKDWWEDAGKREQVYTEGISGIFAQNEHAVPPGFFCTWDDVSSVSDGPAAVVLSPGNGATGVSTIPTLNWVEAKFATGRQLWFGTPGNLQLVEPGPTGTTYTPSLLVPGQTYQWRVDQVGPAGVVTGHTWQFTTGEGPVVDDFESYADNAQITAAWVDNITGAGLDYTFLDTAVISQGAKAMRLEIQNQYDPYITEATRTFASPQDWTIGGADVLSIAFRGKRDNVEHPLYVKVEDAAGKEAIVNHPANYAVQSEPWRSWDIPLADLAGVDLKTVQKLTIGTGNGTSSTQPEQDVDMLYLDYIRLGLLP